jgi:hypothetical protein
MRIALVGASLSGKSTLADYLRDEHGWTKLDYTGLLKEKAAAALTAAGLKTSVEDILSDKKRFRPFLNELGTALGFDTGFGVDVMLSRWAALGSPEPVIWDNVRFEAQAERLRQLGFVTVGLGIDEGSLWKRAIAKKISRGEFLTQYQWDMDNLPEPEILLNGEWAVEKNTDILQRLAGIYLPREAHHGSSSLKVA